jgi:hypothetical protein
MARRARVKEQGRTPSSRVRRRVPRWQIEKQRQRLAFAVGGVVMLFILALPIWGYITTFVMPPRQVVATINGEPIVMRDLVRSVRVSQRTAEASRESLDLGTLPFEALNSLVESELIRQMAPRLGISVGTNAVNSEIRARLLSDVQAENEADLEIEFQERFRVYLNLIQLSEKEYRDRVMLELLLEQIRDVVGREVSPIQPMIHVYQLTVEDQDSVETIQELSGQGVSFEELIKEYEVNEDAKEAEGEVGWLPRGLLPDDKDFIFDLEVGELSEPGLREDGMVVFFVVREKADAREVGDEFLFQLKQSALEEWISETRQQEDVQTTFGSEQYDWLVNQLRNSSRAQALNTDS